MNTTQEEIKTYDGFALDLARGADIVERSTYEFIFDSRRKKLVKYWLAGKKALYEPGLLNPIAFFGRQLFPTNIHVAPERPFVPTSLKKVIVRFKFKIIEEEYYYLFVHMFPILAKWVVFFRKSKLLKLFYHFNVLLWDKEAKLRLIEVECRIGKTIHG